MNTRLEMLGCVLIGAIIVACESPSASVTEEVNLTVANSRDSSVVLDTLARELALVLQSEDFRGMLLEDLRDSPFHGHRIHFQSYLSGSRGRALSGRLASIRGVTYEQLVDDISHLPAMELAISSSIDRVTWEGEPELVVVASLQNHRERVRIGMMTGYDLQGRAVSVPLTTRYRSAVLSLLPASVDFGGRPEEVRSLAPKNADRRTIATIQSEFDECDPETAIIPCDPDDTPSPPALGPTVDVGSECSVYNFLTSSPALDWDGDTIKDSCELAIASAFQPNLVFHVDEGHSGREPYWIVQKIDGNWLSVMYLVAYYYDGPPGSHYGDSEWIRFKLHAAGDSGWAIAWGHLSAHWGVCCGADETKHVSGAELQYLNAKPIIYVSKSHHANYESKARCDARLGDSCSSTTTSGYATLPLVASENIGSRLLPMDIDPAFSGEPDCARSRATQGGWPYTGWECFFSTSWAGITKNYFGGWYPFDGTTHYTTALSANGY